MLEIAVSEVIPGMVLGQKLVSPDGKIRLGQGSVLSQCWISRLRKWKIKEVIVFPICEHYYILNDEWEDILNILGHKMKVNL